MQRPITKEKALSLFNGNGAALARALGITRAAVSEWPKKSPIPENHELRLVYELKPEHFQAKDNAA